ncbi:unnamed protein product [Rotaria sp. Silwood2]|nr:unnamed protein product [Rotaria sp. Silwood2]CAF3997402.1 unnamed protein product [Rotaria sp. Silwood2]
MSGYPYGNPAGSYPPPYSLGNSGYANYSPNSGYQPPPPPIPMYADNQSFASPYNTAASYMSANNNYSATPYNVSQMPGDSYGYGGNSDYQLPPSSGGQMPSSMFNQPVQQYGGFENSQYQQPYSQETPSSLSGGLYPNLSKPAIPSNYGGEGIASSYQPQPQLQHQSFYPQEQPSTILASLEQYQGTVFPASNFNVDADCQALSQAMKGAGTNERALIDIIANRSNTQRQQIKLQYKSMYGVVVKRFFKANRDELSPQQIQQARQMGIESVIDRNRARQDADDLYKAGAGKWGTDEKTFNAIFARRNYYQLRATFEEYQKKYQKDIAKVIRSEFSGDIKDAYLVLISCIRDRPSYFAECIHKAVSGLGTNDSTLIRVIVTRSEIDLAQIKQQYQQIYNRSLAQDVSGDTSGDYKRILLSIIK